MDFEESFFKEKSRIQWMKDRDRNTKYFHSVVKSHIARNKILRLKNEAGDIIEDYELVQDMAVEFFSNTVH